MQKIVYFGSAFNPPHIGHMQCMRWLAAQPEVTKVLAGPSKNHAFGKKMASFEARVEMTRAMIAHHALGACVEVSCIEDILAPHDNSPVYSYNVLMTLQKIYPAHTVVLGLGPDNVEHIERFYRYQEILDQFEILMCPEVVNVRSTMIRKAALLGDLNTVESCTMPTLVPQIMKLYKEK